MMELRRVLFSWKLAFLLLLALAVNIFLFVQTQEKEFGMYASYCQSTSKELLEEYRRQVEEYRAMDLQTAFEQCSKASEEWMKTMGISKLETADQAREMLLSLLTYQAGYPEYLEKVQKNAKQLSGISIFSDKNAFSSKNLKATAEDFAVLEGTELTLGNYYGISALLDYRLADCMILLLMLVVCWKMLEERRKGLWGIVRLCGGSRGKLAVKRAAIFAGTLVMLAALFYGSTLIASFSYFGQPDFQAAAQSVPELQKLPLSLTVGEFLGQYLLVKTAGTFLLLLLVWLILTAVDNTAMAMAVTGIALASEYALFAWLPVQSILNLFKYCNLFSYFFLNEVYEKYLNMNLLGFPVNSRKLLLGLLPVLLAAGLSLVILIGARKRQEGNGRLWMRLYDRVRRGSDRVVCRLHGFGMELYKLLFVQKGLVVLVLLGWLLTQMMSLFGDNIILYSGLLETRLEEWEGPVDSPAVAEKMQKEREYLDGEYAAYEKLQEGYRAGKIGVEELEIASAGMTVTNHRKEVYDQIASRQEELKEIQARTGVTPWILNDSWLEQLIGEDTGRNQRKIGMTVLLFLTILLAPLYAYENQTGARAVIRGAGKGRGRLVLRKQLLAALGVLLVGGMVYGADLWSVVRLYGMRGLDAPVQSVKWMQNSDWHMTLGQLLALVGLARLLVLWSAAQGMLLLSSLVRKVQSAVLAGVFLIVLPSALWVIGVEVLQYASFAWLCVPVEIMAENGFQGNIWIWPFVIVSAAGTACCVLSCVRWCRQYIAN